MKKCIVMCLGLCALVINPLMFASGCGSCIGQKMEPPTYSREDMVRELRAVPTTQSVTLDDGTIISVSFSIDMESLIARANHLRAKQSPWANWVKSAAACDIAVGDAVVFDGEVSITLTEPNGESESFNGLPFRGDYEVQSSRLNQGTLTIADRRSGASESIDYTFQWSTATGQGSDAVLSAVDVSRSYTSQDYSWP